MITTYLDFVGNLYIPNSAPSLAEGANLGKLIEIYEPKKLKDILGFKMYDLMLTNINQGSGIWHDLIAGASYIDLNNQTQYWNGFREVGKNPIANYIYCQWQKQNTTQTTSLGEKAGKAENTDNGNAIYKYKESWNSMVDMLIVLDEFITINKDDYPDYIGLTFPIDCNYYNFNRLPSNINYFKKISTLL